VEDPTVKNSIGKKNPGNLHKIRIKLLIVHFT